MKKTRKIINGGGYFTIKKLIPSLIISGLVLVLIGTSFAIWQITLRQEDTSQLTSSCFKVEFQDKNPVTLENAYPISDEEAKVLVPYEFTISNTCTTSAIYQINLEVLNDTTLENNSYIKLMIDDDVPSVLTINDKVNKTIDNAVISYKIKKSSLEANTSVTHTLRLWMNEDTPPSADTMNKLFKSKVTVITSYVKSIDKTAPVANFTTTIEENSVVVDANSSTDDNSGIENYYYSLDGKEWIKSKESTHTFIEEESGIKYTTATETITNLFKQKVTEVYVKVEDRFENMSEVVRKDIRITELTYDHTADNNLRYIGPNPNNYVTFNNELWRIIGVMNNIDDGTGKKESRIKLMRNDSIGSYSWDTNDNFPNGINEWSQADLMKLMNPGYESQSVGGSLYWNSMSGNCYNGRGSAIVSCDFSNIGLKDTAKNMIGDAVWHTGAIPKYDNGKGNKEMLTYRYYELERGNLVVDSNLWNDKTERKTTWIGKVGLIYPSDVGYSTSEKSCLSEPWYRTSYGIYDICHMNTFFNKNNTIYASITPTNYHISHTIGIDLPFYPYQVTGDSSPVYPSLYLKSNVKITSGTGTSADPFQLSL